VLKYATQRVRGSGHASSSKSGGNSTSTTSSGGSGTCQWYCWQMTMQATTWAVVEAIGGRDNGDDDDQQKSQAIDSIEASWKWS